MIVAVDKPINQWEREENKYYWSQAQKNAHARFWVLLIGLESGGKFVN